MIKRTKTDWDEIITSWKQSGLSHRDYCQKQNINYWTFRDQRLKREHLVHQSSKKNLVRVSPVKREPERSFSTTKVTLPSGITIQISQGAEKDHIQELLGLLWKLK